MKTVPQLCSTFSIDPSLVWQNEIVLYVWYKLEVKNVKMFLDIEKLTLSIHSFQTKDELKDFQYHAFILLIFYLPIQF